jgi:hypothetical protein
VALLLIGLAAAGCATASTRTGQLGTVSGGEPLVTLVVSGDLAVVRQECPLVLLHTALLGCQTSRVLKLADGSSVRAVKVVRYSDTVPSQLAFDIDIHELCHTVAALQPIADPCHAGNDGAISSAPSALPRGLLQRY